MLKLPPVAGLASWAVRTIFIGLAIARQQLVAGVYVTQRRFYTRLIRAHRLRVSRR